MGNSGSDSADGNSFKIKRVCRTFCNVVKCNILTTSCEATKYQFVFINIGSWMDHCDVIVASYDYFDCY